MIEDLKTGERILVFSNELIKHFTDKIENYRFVKYSDYEEFEKYLVFENAWSEMKDFKEKMTGNGRTYDNSITLSFEDFEFFMKDETGILEDY